MSRIRAVKLPRFFTFILVPLIVRILDMATTVYGIGLGKKYVDGWVTYIYESNPKIVYLMEVYPNHWYIIVSVVCIASSLSMLLIRWIVIKRNVHTRYFFVLIDVSMIAVFFICLRPLLNNLLQISHWYNYEGGP